MLHLFVSAPLASAAFILLTSAFAPASVAPSSGCATTLCYTSEFAPLAHLPTAIARKKRGSHPDRVGRTRGRVTRPAPTGGTRRPIYSIYVTTSWVGTIRQGLPCSRSGRPRPREDARRTVPPRKSLPRTRDVEVDRVLSFFHALLQVGGLESRVLLEAQPTPPPPRPPATWWYSSRTARSPLLYSSARPSFPRRPTWP